MAKRAIQSAAAAEDRKRKRHQAQADGRQLSAEEAKSQRVKLASRAMKKLRVRNTKTLFPLLWPLFCCESKCIWSDMGQRSLGNE